MTLPTPECLNLQDNTGKRNNFSPEWEINAGIEFSTNLTNGMGFTASTNWQYVDEHFSSGSELSPHGITDSYNMVDARSTVRT